MSTDLLFVNPFVVHSQLAEPNLDDRMKQVELCLGELIQATLGEEAFEAYRAVTYGIVVDMQYDKDIITDEMDKREITQAWQELGKAQTWLKALGVLPHKEETPEDVINSFAPLRQALKLTTKRKDIHEQQPA